MLPDYAQDEAEPFKHDSVLANGIKLHYVLAGSGDPVLLLPGWPQHWYAWRHVMLRLIAAGRQVYALDPRGYGDSEKPLGGYDLSTAAEDVHCFLTELGLTPPEGIDVITHDLGTWIGYAHAHAYPKEVRRLAVSEATIPGAIPPTGYPGDEVNKKTWQFGFNRLSDLPEILIAGHERAYLSWIFSNKAVRGWQIDSKALDEYERVLRIPGTVRATCSYYREVFSEAGLDAMQRRLGNKLKMPILALGGEGGIGIAMLHSMQLAGTDVRGAELMGCGHFLPEECPEEFTSRIMAFWDETRK